MFKSINNFRLGVIFGIALAVILLLPLFVSDGSESSDNGSQADIELIASITTEGKGADSSTAVSPDVLVMECADRFSAAHAVLSNFEPATHVRVIKKSNLEERLLYIYDDGSASVWVPAGSYEIWSNGPVIDWDYMITSFVVEPCAVEESSNTHRVNDTTTVSYGCMSTGEPFVSYVHTGDASFIEMISLEPGIAYPLVDVQYDDATQAISGMAVGFAGSFELWEQFYSDNGSLFEQKIATLSTDPVNCSQYLDGCIVLSADCDPTTEPTLDTDGTHCHNEQDEYFIDEGCAAVLDHELITVLDVFGMLFENDFDEVFVQREDINGDEIIERVNPVGSTVVHVCDYTTVVGVRSISTGDIAWICLSRFAATELGK